MSDEKPQAQTQIARMPSAPRWSLVPSSLGEAKEIANLIAASDFAPKDYKGKPNNVIIALQMGADLGLKPMQALQNIAVINGRPSIYGDAALALVMPALERFHEEFEGKDDDFAAVCIAKRRGWPDETRRTFSVRDAKAASLWGKSGPWQTYPKRMLQLRARGFALRDTAPDLLLGLVLAEEAGDYPVAHSDAIDAETVVQAPWQAAWERVPEALRDQIEKGFSALDANGGFSPAQRHLKLNEYLVGDVDPEERATALLEWCRDEYAKRKFGQARAPKGENGKTPPASSPPTVEPATQTAAAEPIPPGVVPSRGDSGHSQPEVTPSAETIFRKPHDTNKPPTGELF